MIEHIVSHYKINEEQAHIFLSAFTKKEMKKNDVFIKRGESAIK